MRSYMGQLDQTVTVALTEQRIGMPVFVRWTAALAESNALLSTGLAEMVHSVTDWLGAPLSQLYATGLEDDGHLCLALTYETGVTAIVALTLAHDQPQSNLAIYGNRGAIYHHEIINIPKVPCDSLRGEKNDRAMYKTILAAIDEATSSRQPITLPKSGEQP